MISIITPTYNHKTYIRDCIDSVLAQTYSDWEMIIIDDGSTDGTGDIITEYKDPRIKYLRQENQGINNLSKTYNKALGISKGDLVAILEGDDYWPDYKLEKQIADFERDEVVLSYGSTAKIDSDSVEIIPRETLPTAARFNKPVGQAALLMMDENFLTFTFPVSVVIRRKALERLGGFLQPSCLPLVDYPTFLRLTLEGEFAFHNEILGYWRRHEMSASKSSYPVILDGIYKYIHTFLEEYGTRFSQDEIKLILKKVHNLQALRWLFLGRKLLQDHEWQNARKAFQKGRSFEKASLTRTLALLAGISASMVHFNPERLISIMGFDSIEDIIRNNTDQIFDRQMLAKL